LKRRTRQLDTSRPRCFRWTHAVMIDIVVVHRPCKAQKRNLKFDRNWPPASELPSTSTPPRPRNAALRGLWLLAVECQPSDGSRRQVTDSRLSFRWRAAAQGHTSACQHCRLADAGRPTGDTQDPEQPALKLPSGSRSLALVGLALGTPWIAIELAFTPERLGRAPGRSTCRLAVSQRQPTAHLPASVGAVRSPPRFLGHCNFNQ
jgi:hypothetical protein